MKPSSLLAASILIFSAAALGGCRKEKRDPQGEELVKARPISALSEIRAEDVQAQSLLSQKIIAASLKITKGRHDMVDTLTPTVLLTTLLNASENETSERLVKGMGIPEGRHDRFTKTLQAQLDHLRTEGAKEVNFHAAFWMIWPILLTPDFQEEIGGKLGVSVYRLGNAGLTSTERIKSWGHEHSPERKRFNTKLSKEEVMLATTTCALYLTPQNEGLQTQFKGHTVSFVKTGSILEAIKLSGSDPESLLGQLNLNQLRKEAKPVSKVQIPPLSNRQAETHQKVLEEAGFSYLFTETNDWRYMAMELRDNGLSRIIGFSGTKMRFTDLTGPEPDALVLVWAPASGIVLAGGKGMDTKASGT